MSGEATDRWADDEYWADEDDRWADDEYWADEDDRWADDEYWADEDDDGPVDGFDDDQEADWDKPESWPATAAEELSVLLGQVFPSRLAVGVAAAVGLIAITVIAFLANGGEDSSASDTTPTTSRLASDLMEITASERPGSSTDDLMRIETDESRDGQQNIEQQEIVVTSSELPDADRIAAARYFSDFSDPLGSEWDQYYSPGHAGWGLRRPSAITVAENSEAQSGRALTITARMGTEGEETDLLVSGGLKLLRPHTFGRYTFRIRVDGDPSKSTSGVALLWPTSLAWPRDGEIDIFETWGERATRTPVETNIHHLAFDATEPYDITDDRLVPFRWPGVDGREWNVFELEWRSDLLAVSVNGSESVTLIDDPALIPQWDMELAFQLDGFDSPDRPGSQPIVDGPVQLEVDWVILED